MLLLKEEDCLREAIYDYLTDSSQENYLRLKRLIFGEGEDNNLFQALAKITGTTESRNMFS